MGRPRKLPDNETLVKLFEGGATCAQIARRYGVSTSAVSDLASRHNLSTRPRKASMRAFIPWRVPAGDHGHYYRRMLYFYGRDQLGLPLTRKQRGQMERFRARLDAAFDGRGGVVAYDPGLEDPFHVVPRLPDDIGYARPGEEDGVCMKPHAGDPDPCDCGYLGDEIDRLRAKLAEVEAERDTEIRKLHGIRQYAVTSMESRVSDAVRRAEAAEDKLAEVRDLCEAHDQRCEFQVD